MKQNIITAVIFLSLVANVFFGSIIIMQDDEIAQKEYDLNVSQVAFKIQSSTLNRISDENVALRQANECLIRYSYHDRCITAIKHTLLPKLVTQ